MAFFQYVHDGSDTLSDTLSLVGRTASKTSMPIAVGVRVRPVNDEAPRLKNNTGLDVWAGGEADVDAKVLAAVDKDSPDEKIRFEVMDESSSREGDGSCGVVTLRPRYVISVDVDVVVVVDIIVKKFQSIGVYEIWKCPFF